MNKVIKKSTNLEIMNGKSMANLEGNKLIKLSEITKIKHPYFRNRKTPKRLNYALLENYGLVYLGGS